MKRVFTIIAILALVFAFTGCEKSQGSGSSTNNTEKDDSAQKVITSNALTNTKTVVNPNSFTTEASARDGNAVKADKTKAEEMGGKLIAYIATNGLANAQEEVNKSRSGALSGSLPSNHFYLALLQKKGASWQIVAHGTSRDYVGVEVAIEQWADLSGWQYMKAAVENQSQSTNAVWVNNIYWKDPEWAGGKISRFDAYNRFFTVGSDFLWMHYSVWIDG